MTTYSHLQYNLSYWDRILQANRQAISTLTYRRQQVQAIKSALARNVHNGKEAVNRNIRSTSDVIGDAIKHSGSVNLLKERLTNNAEASLENDTNLSSADYELQCELNEIDRQIEQAESNRWQASSQVSYYRQAIRAEETKNR